MTTVQKQMHEPQRHTKGLSDSPGVWRGLPEGRDLALKSKESAWAEGLHGQRPGGGSVEQLCASVHRALP